MEKFYVKSAKVVCGNFFSLFSSVDNLQHLNERLRTVHHPKFIVVLKKNTLPMKVLNLVENKFERIGHNFTNRFGTAFC